MKNNIFQSTLRLIVDCFLQIVANELLLLLIPESHQNNILTNK